MKNQNKVNSILKVIFVVLGYVIIVVSVCGCKKSELSTEQSHKTVFEGRETSTADLEPIIVDTEVVWRIAKSQQSFSAEHTLEQIEWSLHNLVLDTNARVIGRHEMVDFLNDKGAEIKFDQTQSPRERFAIIVTEVGFINSETSESKVNLIQDEMLIRMQQKVSEPGWGIEIEKVFIKQIRLSEEIQKELEDIKRALDNRERQQREAEERSRQKAERYRQQREAEERARQQQQG